MTQITPSHENENMLEHSRSMSESSFHNVKLTRQKAVDDPMVEQRQSETSLTGKNVAKFLKQPSFSMPDRVFTMTNKEVTSLLPKPTAGENINDYCKKIQHAWKFCETEKYDEAKFCQILRLFYHKMHWKSLIT